MTRWPWATASLSRQRSMSKSATRESHGGHGPRRSGGVSEQGVDAAGGPNATGRRCRRSAVGHPAGAPAHEEAAPPARSRAASTRRRCARRQRPHPRHARSPTPVVELEPLLELRRPSPGDSAIASSIARWRAPRPTARQRRRGSRRSWSTPDAVDGDPGTPRIPVRSPPACFGFAESTGQCDLDHPLARSRLEPMRRAAAGGTGDRATVARASSEILHWRRQVSPAREQHR